MPDPYWQAVAERVERRRRQVQASRAARHKARHTRSMRSGASIGRKCTFCGKRLDRTAIPNPSAWGSYFCSSACLQSWITGHENRRLDVQAEVEQYAVDRREAESRKEQE